MEQKNFLPILLAALVGGAGVWFYQTRMNPHECMCTKKATQVHFAMRKLWEDHIVWTRNFIISAIANLEDKDAVTKRLLQNQVDIGNAIKPYYGNEAGDALTKLLREHILIAADVVADAIANDSKKLKSDNARWHENADEIAAFLSKANPNWSQSKVQDMLYKHLEYTTGEVTSRLKKDWVADIGFYDTNHDHMLMFADILTNGVAKQFPDKFE